MKKPASATDPLWYKDAIIYETARPRLRRLQQRWHRRLSGPDLEARLPAGPGVTCLWLLPFFPSPLRDDGYDIANYVDVNPTYGTLDDFKAVPRRGAPAQHAGDDRAGHQPHLRSASLVPGRAAGAAGLAASATSTSGRDTDQKYKDARIIFTDTEKSNWTWDRVAQAYYWHRFFSHQPDLNFDNPRVMEEVLKAMRFWLDMGVDGAAPGRHSLPGRARRHQLREPAGDARRHQADSRAPSTRTTRTA